MSAGFIAYSMDVDWLAKNLGRAGNDKLYKELTTTRSVKEKMRRLACDFDLTFDDVAAVLREVTHPIAKGREKGHDGAIHYYLVEAIVKFYGNFLDNSKLYSFGIELAKAFDKSLAAAGVPKKAFRLDRFLGVSLPVRLPTPDDFPLVGCMNESEVAVAGEALEKVRLDDASHNDILDEVRDWVWTAEGREEGLVVFYH